MDCRRKLVRGTPLVLLHWWRADFSLVGARFALVDREASRSGRWNCHATTWPRRTNCRYGSATTVASCDLTSPTGSIFFAAE